MNDWTRSQLDLVVEDMRELGLVKARCEYSGSSDEGWVEASSVEADSDAVLGVKVTDTFADRFVTFAEALIEEHYPGWENNEGGEGHVEVDLANVGGPHVCLQHSYPIMTPEPAIVLPINEED